MAYQNHIVSWEVHILRDKYKTKKQLLSELEELRQQVTALKTERAELRRLAPRRTVRVGEILIELGFLTKEQLEGALQKQKEADMRGESHVPVGSILAASGVISREQLQVALTEQRNRLRR